MADKILPQPKSPAPSYLPHCFINSNGIANRKTRCQFFLLRVTPPSNITWSTGCDITNRFPEEVLILILRIFVSLRSVSKFICNSVPSIILKQVLHNSGEY